MFTLGSTSEHLSPERTLPKDPSIARISPVVQMDSERNVGYVYDIPREDLDFLDGTPEPVSNRSKSLGSSEGLKVLKS